jgi:regulator of telomere elongation helicase 1
MVTELSAGPNGKLLRADFANRDTEAYKTELGSALAGMLRVIPDGALVFFPSYGVMSSCITHWQSPAVGLWRRICERKKTALVEARAASELAAQIATFNTAVESGGGAVFFAVARGKVSEGVDFADAHGRAVIVTGLPYPPQFDARVLLKRCLLDEAAQAALAAVKQRGPWSGPGTSGVAAASSSPVTGHQWYSQQAFRAVNQARDLPTTSLTRLLRTMHTLFDCRQWGG